MNVKRILLYESDAGLSTSISGGFALKPNYRVDTCTNLFQFGQKIDSSCADYFGILLASEVLLSNPNYDFTLDNIKSINPFVKIIILSVSESPQLMALLNQQKIDNIINKNATIDDIIQILEKPVLYTQTSVSPITTTNNFNTPKININNMSNLGLKQNNDNYGGYNMAQNNGFPPQGFPQGQPMQQPNYPQGNPQQMGMPPQGFNQPPMGQPPMGQPQPPQGFPQGQPMQQPNYPQGNPQQMGVPPQGFNQPPMNYNQPPNGQPMPMGYNQNPNNFSMPPQQPMQMPIPMAQQNYQQPMNQQMGGMPPMDMNNRRMPMEQQRVVRVAEKTVITVHSPKGGVGKSTISKELAVTYALSAQSQGMKVCLVDMNIDYGNIAVMLNIKPVKTMAGWARTIGKRLNEQSAHNVNVDAIKFTWEEIENHHLLRHSSGLYVLAAPTNHRDAGTIGEVAAQVMLNNLKNYFDILVIDTGPDIKDVTFVSLEKADHLLLICNMEIPTLNDLDQLQKTLKAIGYDFGKIAVVMNETSKDLENDAIETVKYLQFDRLIGLVPRSQNVTIANDNGTALAEGIDNSFTVAIKKIANTLCPIVKAPVGNGNTKPNQKEKKGFFKFGK